mgnify:FL=1
MHGFNVFALLFVGRFRVKMVMAGQVNPFAQRQILIAILSLGRGAAAMRQ